MVRLDLNVFNLLFDSCSRDECEFMWESVKDKLTFYYKHAGSLPYEQSIAYYAASASVSWADTLFYHGEYNAPSVIPPYLYLGLNRIDASLYKAGQVVYTDMDDLSVYGSHIKTYGVNGAFDDFPTPKRSVSESVLCTLRDGYTRTIAWAVIKALQQRSATVYWFIPRNFSRDVDKVKFAVIASPSKIVMFLGEDAGIEAGDYISKHFAKTGFLRRIIEMVE